MRARRGVAARFAFVGVIAWLAWWRVRRLEWWLRFRSGKRRWWWPR